MTVLAGEILSGRDGPGGVEGNHDSSSPVISVDGRFVAFESIAGNLVAGGRQGGRHPGCA